MSAKKDRATKDSDIMDEKNVDNFILDGVAAYAKNGDMISSIFWHEALVLLQKKYNFKIQRVKV